MVGWKQRVRLYLDRARSDTLQRVRQAGEDLSMAIAAAVIASIAVAAGFAEGEWIKTFTAALAAGIGTLFVYLLILSTTNLIASPRRVRQEWQMPVAAPGDYPSASIKIKLQASDFDLMQHEAWVIARLIGDYLDATKIGQTPPYNLAWIEQRITHFGVRAESELWISAKSRKRSRELYARMLATGDLDEKRRLCAAFFKLKASH